jgi:hypothetical protein
LIPPISIPSYILQISLVLSAGLLLISAIGLPLIIRRIPHDYLINNQRKVLPLAIVFFKNFLGFVLLVLGILMLILPGQGLLTILVAMILMDFPGKHQLERKILTRPSIFNLINYIRRQSGHPPLIHPENQ